ncbi:MAG: NAD(P)/FAD-dependent oxidoreductase [Saprospiraceae bacterium]|nr:NAD(P)/FAD-dependent oxidoreductase [Saprospiraceae bacterium]
MIQKDIIIIGGGAAGFFAAINAKELNPGLKISILEQAATVLNKVRISGGGRCNVTHHCFDPKELTGYYPRGQKELLGPFYSFGANDTVEWFESRGVKLYTEPDGCMFPVSNNSDSIIQCFLKACSDYDIEIINRAKMKDFTVQEAEEYKFSIFTETGTYQAKKMMVATGSSPFMWNLLEQKGYNIVSPLPSLFTFNIPEHPIRNLMGLVVTDGKVTIEDSKISTTGPILITHWGLSGPAVLKASAWGARLLGEKNYHFRILVDWIPKISEDDIRALKDSMAKKKVITNARYDIPARLWTFLTESVLTDKDKNWASLSKEELNLLVKQLKNYALEVKGKTTFKEEFVTAGGVSLSQIHFKSFESKIHKGLYMAGEVIDIDAVTGGFNFQAAWTGGFLAGKSMAEE